MRTGKPPLPRGPLRIYGQLAFVPLTRGYSTAVDLLDLPRVLKHKWFAMVTDDGKVYAKRNASKRSEVDGPRSILLHRFLMGTPQGMETDHISGNSLDNRRQNLRNATRFQNGSNLKKSKANSSGRKGVTWDRRIQKWRAKIAPNRTTVHLGAFDSLEEAGQAYDRAALAHFGEFARTNEQLQ